MWTDEDEELVDAKIVPLRGRDETVKRSYNRTEFTTSELDELAPPLTASDLRHLSDFRLLPPKRVRRKLEARIQAARQLKYGGAE